MNIPNLEIGANTYYTPEEVAAMLRVSRRSVHNLLESWQARGVKIGRYWRLLGLDLLQLSRADEISDAEQTRSFMRLPEPAFDEIWDNDEDSIYDMLSSRRRSAHPLL